MRRQQRTTRRCPLRPTHTGTPLRRASSSGSSPTSAGVANRRSPDAVNPGATVAATDDAGPEALRPQFAGQPECQGRLAGTADGDVADDDTGTGKRSAGSAIA
jgi:hypothetical protein